jgi:cytochrome c-type biogenesis protein CcmH/NrfG
MLKLGRRDDALKAFDKAVQLRPDDPELWWHMGNVLIEAVVRRTRCSASSTRSS